MLRHNIKHFPMKKGHLTHVRKNISLRGTLFIDKHITFIKISVFEIHIWYVTAISIFKSRYENYLNILPIPIWIIIFALTEMKNKYMYFYNTRLLCSSAWPSSYEIDSYRDISIRFFQKDFSIQDSCQKSADILSELLSNKRWHLLYSSFLPFPLFRQASMWQEKNIFLLFLLFDSFDYYNGVFPLDLKGK